MAVPPSRPLLFVYGTLCRGGELHGTIAAQVVSSAPAEARGEVVHLPEGYPALLSTGRGRVLGELLTLAGPEGLRIADEVEGFRPDRGTGFRRVRKLVRTEGAPAAARVRAWCYVFARVRWSDARSWGIAVPDGDWRRFRGLSKGG